MSKSIQAYIQQKLDERITKNSLRTLQPENGLVDFCSNDYLGISRSEELRDKVENQLSKLTGKINGSTGARTIAGTSKLLLDLEDFLADFHGAESALFFNSGYSANVGLFSALPYRGDTIIYDELIHASIRDGMRMGRANSYSFRHNDLAHLEERLGRAKGNIFVAVEAIYSMDGDAAPLKEIAEICKKYDAALVVDEAHSNGIFGPKGRGIVSELGLEKDVFARVMTFGKAVGSHGAAVLGGKNLKPFLINYARSFIYTTAPAPHQVLSVKSAYDILSCSDNNRLKMSSLQNLIKEECSKYSKLRLIPSNSPIQCVIIPGNDKVKRVCKAVQDDGFDVRPIVAPTVPIGVERIRICLHVFNTEEEVKGLVKSLATHLESEL